MDKFFNNIWYSKYNIFIIIFLPITIIYFLFISLRRFLYSVGFFKITNFHIPIIIIGNLTVGGSGKTPLCIWIANYLFNKKVRVGIVSSGYKSSSEKPQLVNKNSDPLIVGDEAVVLCLETQATIVSGGNRVEATQYLLNLTECDIILHDDGLQHYALARNYEILLIDSNRRFGNRFLLPSGPLREPISRIKSCDMIVQNQFNSSAINRAYINSNCNFVRNTITKKSKKLSDFYDKEIHLVIGVANIDGILATLKENNIKFILHRYDDHFSYSGNECSFADDKPVFLTMKDYVKLKSSDNEKIWVMQHSIKPNDYFIKKLDKDLSNIISYEN